MKILIILPYYNRPTLVKNALRSIQESTYLDWELAFIDDGSVVDGSNIVSSLFTVDQLAKTRFYSTGDSQKQKEDRGGSNYGMYANRAMSESSAEIVIILCDDDALLPSYLENLNAWFINHPEENYCYSHVLEFNPTLEDYHTVGKKGSGLNKTDKIAPACQVDASQVAWRKSDDVLFPFPQTGCLDAEIFGKLTSKYGLCSYSGFDGQYKAMFPQQLGNRRKYEGAE